MKTVWIKRTAICLMCCYLLTILEFAAGYHIENDTGYKIFKRGKVSAQDRTDFFDHKDEYNSRDTSFVYTRSRRENVRLKVDWDTVIGNRFFEASRKQWREIRTAAPVNTLFGKILPHIIRPPNHVLCQIGGIE